MVTPDDAHSSRPLLFVTSFAIFANNRSLMTVSCVRVVHYVVDGELQRSGVYYR
jgi:hypothetical protein